MRTLKIYMCEKCNQMYNEKKHFEKCTKCGDKVCLECFLYGPDICTHCFPKQYKTEIKTKVFDEDEI